MLMSGKNVILARSMNLPQLFGMKAPTPFMMTQARFFSHPHWNKKTIHHFKPEFYDNTNYQQKRRWNVQRKNFRYRT